VAVLRLEEVAIENMQGRSESVGIPILTKFNLKQKIIIEPRYAIIVSSMLANEPKQKFGWRTKNAPHLYR
jgi:hypothetical protein